MAQKKNYDNGDYLDISKYVLW